MSRLSWSPFRKHTLLPLDDCLYALQSTIPQLTRSALHRCFQRHGIIRLPDLDGQRPVPKKKFKVYPIGYFHVDLTEVRTAEGKLYLFVAVDRTSKFTFARLVPRATRRVAAEFLQELIEAIPIKFIRFSQIMALTSPHLAICVQLPRISNWHGSEANASGLILLS